ncbi:hypothetical protein [Pelagicoccus sp. SDUM812005]|uniref:hypothetical protein n=1 Tax=Pelagicoccus sp. SDUM812005 TaxID=3041257 RepID=UPI0028108F56|nr:hypothetical protein [Pelagicoccus sp. SDUM812005]MDQ8183879.1 hypothetical protein [Pelagicoccus sp. SDUM812005]
MTTTTSPWSYKTTVLSPDGKFTADYDEAMEVGQGAPTRGTLTIEGNDKKEVISRSAGASMTWSDDSRFLAFSEWTKKMNQILCIYDTKEKRIDRATKEYRVIELKDFKNGIIHGIDSPIHRSKEIHYEYINLAEQGACHNAGKPAS